MYLSTKLNGRKEKKWRKAREICATQTASIKSMRSGDGCNPSHTYMYMLARCPQLWTESFTTLKFTYLSITLMFLLLVIQHDLTENLVKRVKR